MISIDGSLGEGGGQVLRTALGLSAHTGRGFEICNIRSTRGNPGLGRQHLTAVRAATQICAANVQGAEMRSTSLRFEPGRVRGGDYQFSVGTAGSANLVLQTILPALILCDEPSTVVVEGGTHNPTSPPFHYLDTVFLPIVRGMGPAVDLSLQTWGFYPAGGGQLTARITPVQRLQALSMDHRGVLGEIRADAVVSSVPRRVARRELAVVQERLGLPRAALQTTELKRLRGPGNVLMVTVVHEQITELFTAFGARGVSSEQVAEQVCAQVQAYLAHGAPVAEHLADQLLIPLALAGSGSFRTGALSAHTTTNISVIERFLPVKFTTAVVGESQWQVSVGAA